MYRSGIPLLLAFVALAADGCHESSDRPTSSVYFVGVYDESRDPFADLKASSKKARSEGKKILLQVGGNWCKWCHRMTEFFEASQAIRQLISDHYVFVKINYSEENLNEEFLQQYPPIEGYPHLLVLDASGDLVHSQDTAEFEDGDSYDEDRIVDFLRKYSRRNATSNPGTAPERTNAEETSGDLDTD